MKPQLTLVLFLFSMFQSCKKDIGNAVYKANSTMTYKIDGRQVNIAGDLASVNDQGIGVVITYSTNTDEQGKFKTFAIHGQKDLEDAVQINLRTEQLEQKEYIIKPGATVDPFNFFSMRTPNEIFGTSGDSSIVRVVITQISGISVYGTFSGIVGKKMGMHYNAGGEMISDYEYHSVTEGEFKDVKIVE